MNSWFYNILPLTIKPDSRSNGSREIKSPRHKADLTTCGLSFHTFGWKKPFFCKVPTFFHTEKIINSIFILQSREISKSIEGIELGRTQITPDIIRSTIDKNDLSYIEFPSIDNLFSAPDKISIPERYIPELVISYKL
jgi:hypothetical protein